MPSIDFWAKVVIPITTFVLGSALTLGFKKYDQRKATFRQHVELASSLTIDWYTQLLELNVQLKEIRDKKSKKAAMLVYAYVHNRLILPKLLLSLEILENHKRAAVLRAEVMNFLHHTTDYDEQMKRSSEEGEEECRAYGGGGTKCADLLTGKKQDEIDSILSELDDIAQRARKEAARLLA